MPSSRSGAAPAAPVERPRLARRLWLPILLTLLVLGAALVAASPIRDAATHGIVEEARLDMPGSYLVLAPLFGLLDAITLLSVAQHAALLATVAALWILWLVWPRGRRGARAPRSARRALAVGLLVLATVALLYGLAALTARPMAQLVVERQEVVIVDGHAHTRFGEGARSGWQVESMRSWLRRGGFDAAYLADAHSFEGVQEGYANNPRVAGEGVTLLPAVEASWRGQRVTVLSAGRTYNGLTDPTMRTVDEQALALASLLRGKEPVLVQVAPATLPDTLRGAGPGTSGIRAVELVTGSPWRAGLTRRSRPRVARLADSLGLALVSASSQKGWGATAAAWTLFRIPGWRSMEPSQLAESFEAAIRFGGREATRVVERRVPEGDGPLELLMTLPALLWNLLHTLSPEERLVWLLWTWAIALAGLARGRRRAASTSPSR